MNNPVCTLSLRPVGNVRSIELLGFDMMVEDKDALVDRGGGWEQASAFHSNLSYTFQSTPTKP